VGSEVAPLLYSETVRITDRVPHFAAPALFEGGHFHPHSYACRKGKGTHAASGRLQQLLARNRWFLQTDIRQYFPSIDHEILKGLFRRRIKDQRLLAVMDAIVDGSNPQDPVLGWFPGDELFTPYRRRRGLPIGNLTSQWFANWYLEPFDHGVTSQWRVGGYVRYCDDFVLLEVGCVSSPPPAKSGWRGCGCACTRTTW
jgi:hypothetical protein